MAYVSPDNQALVMDPSTGEELARLEGAEGTIYALAFGPRGNRLAAGTEDGQVLVFDVAAGRVVHRTLLGDLLEELEAHRSLSSKASQRRA